MVNHASAYDFSAVIDGLLASKKIRGSHSALITAAIRDRALSLLSHPDVRYMPAFKILDMLAALVNIGAAISEATQLRPAELQALLRESLSDGTALMRHFMLEAALERARYEPLMLSKPMHDARVEREYILERRWASMRAAHQEKSQLPDHWMDSIDSAVEQSINADEFQHFRQGPLLQLFAEMLALGRTLYQQNAPLATLEHALEPRGVLWRRYALKSTRYSEKASPPPDISRLQPPHTIH